MRQICKRCQLLHTKCTSHRRDGNPCLGAPVTGAEVCRMHGGSSPQVKAVVEQRKASDQAQKVIRRILDNPDAEPVDDALGALARLAGRLEHAVDEVGRRASELTSVGVITVAGGEQLRAELQLWDKLLGHLRSSLDALARHGFAERQVQLAEREADLLESVIRRVLEDLHLSAEQQAMVAEVVPRHLRAVAG
jgi:hypothetical protein